MGLRLILYTAASAFRPFSAYHFRAFFAGQLAWAAALNSLGSPELFQRQGYITRPDNNS
jgi:hypothetical protein